MGEYTTGTFGYFEFVIRAKVKGTIFEYPQTGHYFIVDQDRAYLMLKDEEIEIPVAKKNIRVFVAKKVPQGLTGVS